MVLLAAFVLWERHLKGDPLIDPGLLTHRTYASGILVALAFFGAFGGLLLCVSLYAQIGENWSPVHAGLTLMPMVLGMVAGMISGMSLVKRLGRHLLHVGVVVLALGMTGLAFTALNVSSASTLDLAPALVVVGMGAGMSFGQLFDFILASVPMEQIGSASGVLEATQQLSTAIGVAGLGTIFFAGMAGHGGTHALAITALACLAPLALTFGLIYTLPMRAREEPA